MGFVDEFNKHVALNRTRIHCNARSYLRIFFHFLDVSIVNSWLLYRRDCVDLAISNKKVSSLHEFKGIIAEGLLLAGKTKRRRRPNSGNSPKSRPGPRSSVPSRDVRNDGLNHWPVMQQQGRCKNSGCTAKLYTGCHKCKVHLSIIKRNCFAEFHDADI